MIVKRKVDDYPKIIDLEANFSKYTCIVCVLCESVCDVCARIMCVLCESVSV